MTTQSSGDEGVAEGSLGVTPYHLVSPLWRPNLSQDVSALDVPDFYGPTAGQLEADMSESSVKAGISSKPAVGNETFSAHDMIYDRLTTGGIASQLGSFFGEISVRKQELQRNCVEDSDHRVPPRVTLNPAKLNAYIKDLADASIPLHRLSRSVPHGYRGEQMLDMLSGDTSAGGASTAAQSSTTFSTSTRPTVDVARAVWFTRAVGASEMVRLNDMTKVSLKMLKFAFILQQTIRSRPNVNYTAETTISVTNWLRRQLSELAIPPNMIGGIGHLSSTIHQPSSPALTRPPLTPSRRAGQNASSFAVLQSTSRDANALMDADHHQRWLSKWMYSISLTRRLLAEGLLDQRVFLSWTLESLAGANLSQLSVILSLVHELTETYASSSILSRALAETLASRVEELQQWTVQHEFLTDLESHMRASLRTHLLLVPEALHSPRLWKAHAALFHTLLTKDEVGEQILAEAKQCVEDLLLDDFDLRTTSEEGHRKWCIDVRACRLSEVGCQLLKSFTLSQQLEAFGPGSDFHSLFSALCDPSTSSLADETIEAILFWATTTSFFGLHRVYLAAQLLRQLIASSDDTNSASTMRTKDYINDLNPILTRWLTEAVRANAAEAERASQSRMEDTDEVEEGAERMQSTVVTPRQKLFATIDLSGCIVLYGELIRVGAFSYSKYLQRLAARGITGFAHSGAISNGASSRSIGQHESAAHCRVLRSLPIYAGTSALLHQRRAALYGSRTKETWEEATERRAIREVEASFPWLARLPEQDRHRRNGISEISDAEGTSPMKDVTESSTGRGSYDLMSTMPHLQAGSLYVRVRVLSSHVIGPAIERAQMVDVQRCTLLVTLLNELQDYAALSSLILALFDTAVSENLLRLLCATVIENVSIWTSLRSLPLMISQIILIHQRALVVNAWDALAGTSAAISALGALGILDAPDTSALLAPPDSTHLTVNFVSPTNLASTVERLMRAPELLEDTVTTLSLGPGICFELIDALLPVAFGVARRTSLPLKPLVHLLSRLCQMTRQRCDRAFLAWAGGDFLGESTSPEKDAADRRTAEVIAGLVATGQLDPIAVLRSFALPSIAVKIHTRRVSIALEVLKTCFLCEMPGESTERNEERIYLRAVRQLLLRKQYVPLVMKVLHTLATFEEAGQDEIHSAARSTWRTIASIAPVRSVVLPNVSTLLPHAAVEDDSSSLSSTILRQIFAVLDSESLLATASDELTSSKVSSRLEGWTCRRGAFELIAVVQDHTQKSDAGISRKISVLADCAFEPLYGPDGNCEAGKEVLQAIGSGTFSARLADIGVQNLSKAMERLSTKDLGAFDLTEFQQCLAPLVRIQQALGNGAGSILSHDGEASSSLLMHVVRLLEGYVTSDNSSPKAEERLYAVLQTLWLLLRITGATSSKTLASRLLRALGKLAIQRAGVPADESIFTSLLESIAYAQDQLPGEVCTAAIPSLHCIDQALTSAHTTGLPLPCHNAARLRTLSVHAVGRSALNDLTFARSARHSSASGQIDASDALLKPWMLLEHMHPPHVSRRSDSKDRPSEISPATAAANQRLKDQGSVSLAIFGALSTQDPLPKPSSEIPDGVLAVYENPVVNNLLPVEDPEVAWRMLSSEWGYGSQGGGDSIFATAQRWGNIFLTDEGRSHERGANDLHGEETDGADGEYRGVSPSERQGRGSEYDPVDLTESPEGIENATQISSSASISRKRKQKEAPTGQRSGKAVKSGRNK